MQVLANAIRTALLTAIIVLGVGGAAVAEPVEDAFAAAQRGDFETALRLWRPLADQGYAKAQFKSCTTTVKAGMRSRLPENDVQAYKW